VALCCSWAMTWSHHQWALPVCGGLVTHFLQHTHFLLSTCVLNDTETAIGESRRVHRACPVLFNGCIPTVALLVAGWLLGLRSTVSMCPTWNVICMAHELQELAMETNLLLSVLLLTSTG